MFAAIGGKMCIATNDPKVAIDSAKQMMAESVVSICFNGLITVGANGINLIEIEADPKSKHFQDLINTYAYSQSVYVEFVIDISDFLSEINRHTIYATWENGKFIEKPKEIVGKSNLWGDV